MTILDAEVIDELNIVNNSPGKVFLLKNNQPIVICGSGLLKITNIVFRENDSKYIFNKTRIRFQ